MSFHGHKLLEEHIPNKVKGRTIIEIGSVREHLEGQNSTGFFMDLCVKRDMNLISVDMDPDCTENVKKEALRHDNPSFKAITMRGEDYLDQIGSFDYLYLDGFDYDHRAHSKERKDRYSKILDCEITNDNCWKSHLDMVKAVADKGKPYSLICIDDVLSENHIYHRYKGKGETAIPWLKENGWEEIERKYQAVIFRRLELGDDTPPPQHF